VLFVVWAGGGGGGGEPSDKLKMNVGGHQMRPGHCGGNRSPVVKLTGP
jgi:hypothetical protein